MKKKTLLISRAARQSLAPSTDPAEIFMLRSVGFKHLGCEFPFSSEPADGCLLTRSHYESSFGHLTAWQPQYLGPLAHPRD
ncbi:hypothetical protein E2C01_059880 [Portunus trituberculatus]|uniref:Uncharacterized protein n=1 Tax=Portunus trituberculatus TaxID=210409 RepID=A0A5B7H7U4_PORTR|nr:hypothetical protein [Portunus trituberculatus]